MTREEADKLQKFIDHYIALRDAPRVKEVEDKKPETSAAADGEDPNANAMSEAFRKLKKKARSASSHESRVLVCRMNLAAYIEPMIPEARLAGEDSMDFMAMVGTFASVLGIKIERSDGWLSVVDGHEAVDLETVGDTLGDGIEMTQEEYERLYCVRVPGDVMKEALNLRSSKAMFELGSKLR